MSKSTITLQGSKTAYEVPLKVKLFFDAQNKVFNNMREQVTKAGDALDSAFQKGFDEGKKSMVFNILDPVKGE